MQEYTRGTGLQPCKRYVDCSTIVYLSPQRKMWSQKLLGQGKVEMMVRKMGLFLTD